MDNFKLLKNYKPIELTDAESARLRSLMTGAFGVLTRAAKEKFNGFPQIKNLRDLYKKDHKSLWFHPRARRVMDDMINEESTILRGHIKLSMSLCKLFNKHRHQRPSVTMDDYLQECAAAIYDAQYMYNGSNEFSTYVMWAMRNRLVTFIRTQQPVSGMGKGTISLREDCRSLMKTNGLTADEAIAQMGLSKENAECVRRSMSRRAQVRVETNGSDEDGLALLFGREEDPSAAEDINDLYEAIDRAGLSAVQHKLIDAYLKGIKGFQTKMANDIINPSTGRPYSKQTLSNLFREACQKIGSAYSLEQKAA